MRALPPAKCRPRPPPALASALSFAISAFLAHAADVVADAADDPATNIVSGSRYSGNGLETLSSAYSGNGFERSIGSYDLSRTARRNVVRAYKAYSGAAGFHIRLNARELFLYMTRFVKGMTRWVQNKGWDKYTCSDLQPPWESRYGTNCKLYSKHHWCMTDGNYGPTWLPKWGHFANWSVDGIDASIACCACGGGRTSDPEGSPARNHMIRERNVHWFQKLESMFDDEWPVALERDVENINKANLSWTAGMPEGVDDLALKDLKRLCGVHFSAKTMALLTEQALLEEKANSSVRIQTSIDWRTQMPKCSDVFSHVRDQGVCGSCWAQSAAGALEGRICIASGGRFSGKSAWVSAGHLTSCASPNGCSGGDPRKAFEWAATSGGVPTGADYRHRTTGQSCAPYFTSGDSLHHFEQSSKAPACASGCTDKRYPRSMQQDKLLTTKGAAKYIMSARKAREELQNGPIVLAFRVYSDFMTYKSGVYKPTSNRVTGMHGTTCIGYGPGYFLAMNSWGSNWGNRGSFMISDTCCKLMFITSGAVPSQPSLPLPGDFGGPVSPSRNQRVKKKMVKKRIKPKPECSCASMGLRYGCCGDSICSSGVLGPETSLNCPVDCKNKPPPPTTRAALFAQYSGSGSSSNAVELANDNDNNILDTSQSVYIGPETKQKEEEEEEEEGPLRVSAGASRRRRRQLITTQRRRAAKRTLPPTRRRRGDGSYNATQPTSDYEKRLEAKVDILGGKVDALANKKTPLPPPCPPPTPPPPSPPAPPPPSPYRSDPEPSPPPTPALPPVYSWDDEILDIHNTYRCMHGTAFLAWDDELAAEAKKYAAQGVFRLASKRQLYLRGQIVGENMGKGSSVASLVGSWHHWKGSSTYGQLLWSSTTRLGCGKGPNAIIVCRYSKKGNIAGLSSARIRPLDRKRTKKLCASRAAKHRPTPAAPAPTQYCGRSRP